MIFYKCWCGKIVLAEVQYFLAKFNRCPYCRQHLSEFKLVESLEATDG